MRPRWLYVTIVASTLLGCSRVQVPGTSAGQVSLLAYVTQFNTNEVDVVGTTSKTPVGQPIKVGQGPIRAILAPGGSQDYLYVANKTGNTVSFVNRRTQFDEKDVAAGTDPEDLTFQTIQDANPSNQQFLFVSNPAAKTVTRINVATQAADATYDYSNGSLASDTGFTPAGIVSDPSHNRIFVVSSTVEQQSTGTVANGIVSVLQNNKGSGLSELTSFTLPGAVKPYRIVLCPKTNDLYISDQGRAQIYQVGPLPANIQTTVPTVTPVAISGTNITGGTWGLAVSPDGQDVYAALPQSNGMVQIPTGTLQVAGGVLGTGGNQPEPLAMSNDGAYLWIGNVGSSTLFSTDLTGIPCGAKGSPCQAQGPIPYSLDTSSAQPPGDIVLAPGIG